jgi:hypothetical protein
VAGDFTIVPSPIELSIFPGETASFTLTVEKIGELRDSVAFTGVSGHPVESTMHLMPEAGIPRYSADLRIETPEYTPPGTYLILVEASGGGKTHSETLTLIIKEISQETSISTANETESESESNQQSDMVSLLSNPTNLMMIIIAVLAVGLIGAFVRRRTPTYSRPLAVTKFCVECGEPLKPGKAFCSSCGKRVE